MEKFDLIIRKLNIEEGDDPGKYIRKNSRKMLVEELNLYIEKYGLYVSEDESSYSISDNDIEEREKGKPYIEGAPFAFSVSHTGNFWSVMIGPENCGFDIQETREVRMKKLAARYFKDSDYRKHPRIEGSSAKTELSSENTDSCEKSTEGKSGEQITAEQKSAKQKSAEKKTAEQDDIREISDEEFFTLWTRREAYSKYTGAGFFDSERISEFDTDIAFYDFMPMEGIYGCCCTQGPCEVELTFREQTVEYSEEPEKKSNLVEMLKSRRWKEL